MTKSLSNHQLEILELSKETNEFQYSQPTVQDKSWESKVPPQSYPPKK